MYFGIVSIIVGALGKNVGWVRNMISDRTNHRRAGIF